MIARQITATIKKDLTQKMVLLAGPRQCGKTALAKSLVQAAKGAYFNWDIERDRKQLMDHQLPSENALWAFDEIHKYRRWRNWLKGVFDEYAETKTILVTGSAKLDVYSRGGDSLQGRYHFHRLHPFTLSEATGRKAIHYEQIPHLPNSTRKSDTKTLLDLLHLGGFPEPFLSSSKGDSDRWRLAYGTRVLREEVSSMEKILEIDRMELLFQRLGDTLMSPLSINSLREDLEVAFETVRNWLSIFENLYLCFRVPPFGPARLKAVKKEQKLYFWDWSRALTDAAKAENIAATHLLRLCHWIEDVEGQAVELRYFRTRMGHEVDFVILKSNKPWMAIEVKSSQQDLDSSLKYFLERVKVPFAFQLHLNGEKDWTPPAINGCNVRVLPLAKFLAQLP